MFRQLSLKNIIISGSLCLLFAFTIALTKARAASDMKYTPITLSSFINSLNRNGLDEEGMGRLINQGVNSGFAIIAYNYFLNRVKEQPNSARLNLYLSWSAYDFWMYIGFCHSSVPCGSSAAEQVYETGQQAAERAYVLSPNSAIGVSSYGSTLWEDGRRKRDTQEMDHGMSLLRRGVILGPNLATTHYDLGSALFEKGLGRKPTSETFTEIKKAIELAPNNSGAHLLLCDAYLDEGNKTKSNEEFGIAAQLRDGAPMVPMMTAKEPGSPWRGN